MTLGPLTGEHGPIDSIKCTFIGTLGGRAYEEELVTVTVGQIMDVGPENAFEDHEVILGNCPRLPRYDASQPLGCITCTKAEITYDDGTVTGPFPI